MGEHRSSGWGGAETWLGRLALALSLLVSPVIAEAADRGISVELRESEATGAKVVERIQLYPRSYALVIGINDYTDGWPGLQNAVADAREVAEALQAAGFEVTLETNLRSDELRRSLREFFARKGADFDARLLLWFAGHGHSIGGEGFLVPSDAPPANDPEFKVKALHMRDFGGLMRLADANHVLSIFDACFSGTIFTTRAGATPKAITAKTVKAVRQFITSGTAGQQVRDDGSFRTLFLRALSGESDADFNDDRYVTGEELGLYLSQQVTTLTAAAQTPRYGKLHDVRYNEGDFVFQVARISLPNVASDRPSADDASMMAWRAIKDSKAASDFQVFLDAYPKSPMAPFARDRLKRLQATKVAAVQKSPKPTGGTPAKPAVGTYPKEYKPGDVFKDCNVCPEMVVVPAGSFMMGSPSDDKNQRNERPQHRVTIPKPFAVGKFEVTFDEWDACVSSGGCNGYRPEDRGWGRDRRPVVNVSWKDAKAYVAWLKQKTGKKYRLLSESEWEYAGRAGTTTPFHFGATISSAEANFQPFGSEKERYRRKTLPVGSFAANQFGLHDMHGNVWEWVEDCWNSYSRPSPMPPNFSGAKRWGDCRRRIARGGSWYTYLIELRLSYRYRNDPESRSHMMGFRVARTLWAPEPNLKTKKG